MSDHTPSGQQAVDIEAALRWADRHEARERQKLRDMGLPPEGDMPVTGAFFVRGLVAMLRTAAPTAPSTAARERERLEEERNRLSNHFGYGARLDGSTRDRIAAIDARLAALATPPAQALPSPRLVSEEDGEHEAFILRYSDTEMRDEVFAGHGARDAAFRRFEQQAIAWTCGLFQRIRRTGGGPLATDPHATPPAQSLPWQEQAARWHEEQAGHATVLALAEPSLSGASHFLQAEVAHHQHARDLRALLSKPAKGEG